MSKWIEKLKEIYHKNYSRYEKEYQKGKKEIERIKTEFSIEKWDTLTVKEYKTNGEENNTSLTYLLENRVKKEFRNLPNPVLFDSGYGFIYDKKRNEYKIGNDKFGKGKGNSAKKVTEEEINVKWEVARKNISEFLKSLENATTYDDIKMPIKENIIDTMLFIDLGYIYYPEKMIGNIKFLYDMARQLNIDTIPIEQKFGDNKKIALNFEVNKQIRKEPEFKDANGYILSSAIWDACGNFMQEKRIESKEEKNNPKEEINEPKEKDIRKEYCFTSNEQLEEIKEILEYKKNIILEGVPGVGKTYLAKKIAEEIVGQDKNENIFMVQFHQNYSYEDFIEGLRPSGQKNGEFEVHAGIMKKICNQIKEENKWDEKFVLIIDEINRGNISKIFGETFMLIEENKRCRKDEEKYTMELPYSQEKFSVPENLYIIGTMNSIDRSIALFDFALRRRFAMYEIEPCFNDDRVQSEINNYLKEVNSKRLDNIWNKIKKLNQKLEQEDANGIKIGHSYLCGLNNYPNERKEKVIDMTIKYEILPQIKEYFIGNEQRFEKIKRALLDENSDDIEEEL